MLSISFGFVRFHSLLHPVLEVDSVISHVFLSSLEAALSVEFGTAVSVSENLITQKFSTELLIITPVLTGVILSFT